MQLYNIYRLYVKKYNLSVQFLLTSAAWKKTEQEWEVFLESLPADGQKRAAEMKECLEDFSSAQEKRACIQGYADCIQVLFHMGLLKENEGLKWAEKMDVH